MSNVAIVQEEFNREDPLSTLKLVTKPIPKASPGEVVVHVKLRSVLRVDFFTVRSGGGGTPGGEGFGIVHEVGEGVTKFHRGQRVIPYTSSGSLEGSRNGSWQQYVCIAAENVWSVPNEMSDEQAAQFIINPWTAYSALKEFRAVPRGQSIIQTGASSTVGKQVISVANHWGIQLISVVRRPEQKAELKELGAHHEVICSAEEDVVARVKEITAGRGAWAALDAVAGDMTQTLASSLQDGGRILVYGALGGFTCTISVPDLIRGVSVTGFVLSTVTRNLEKREACAAEVAALVTKGGF